MAIGETMSNPSDHWMQLYQTNFISNVNPMEIPPPTAATTTVTTTMTTASASRNYNNLTLDQGRIVKPIRRRTRASQRTPTTIINTDPTNFRTMVQQFTGGPSFLRSQLSGNIGIVDFTQRDVRAAALVPRAQYPYQREQHNMFMMHDDTYDGGSGGGSGVSPDAPPGTFSANDQNQSYDHSYML